MAINLPANVSGDSYTANQYETVILNGDMFLFHFSYSPLIYLASSSFINFND